MVVLSNSISAMPRSSFTWEDLAQLHRAHAAASSSHPPTAPLQPPPTPLALPAPPCSLDIVPVHDVIKAKKEKKGKDKKDKKEKKAGKAGKEKQRSGAKEHPGKRKGV